MPTPSEPRTTNQLYRVARGFAYALTLLLASAASSQAQSVTTPSNKTVDADSPTAAAANSKPVTLSTEQVTAHADIQVPLKPEEEAQKLNLVPGGTSIISGADVEHARVQTDADVLAYIPGVYAQPVDGSDRLKINIRGSSINRAGGTGSFYSGVYMMFDGLPVTGPGGTPYELFEPLGLAYTEVLKGANGEDYGAVALGGAINFVSKTGYDASIADVRFETGSFGYVKAQASSGLVRGNWDYYISLTESQIEGFRQYTRSSAGGAEFNLGYKFNDNLSNRIYVRHRYTFNETGAGSLTKKQIEDDPGQIAPVATDPKTGLPTAIGAANLLSKAFSRRIQPGSTWIADKLVLKIDDNSSLTAGAVFHDYPIDQEGSAFPAAYSYKFISTYYPNGYYTKGVWYLDDATLSLHYSNTHPLFNLKSDFAVGGVATRAIDAGVERYFIDPATGVRTLVSQNQTNGSQDSTYYIRENLEIVKDLWATVGLSEAVIRRTLTYVKPITVETGAPYKNTDNHSLPRFGLRYDVNPDLSVFGNISQSVEPLNAWAISSGPPYFTPGTSGQSTLVGTTTASTAVPLKDQTAISEEFGVKGQKGIFSGSLGVFREHVTNELLTVLLAEAGQPYKGVTQNVNLTAQSNASPTIKQGIEAALDTQLWKDGGGQSITFRQAYTYSDFHYINDPVFHKSKEPGLPPHFYQGEFLYNHPSGFYAGLTFQYSSSYFVDYANTFKTDPYTLWGVNLGYQPSKKHWSVFGGLQNIGNSHFAASVSPSFNAAGADTAISSPGAPFSWSAGFDLAF